MSYGENEEWRIEVAWADYAAVGRNQQLQTVVSIDGPFGARKKDVSVRIRAQRVARLLNVRVVDY
jgi:hypothetical protein